MLRWLPLAAARLRPGRVPRPARGVGARSSGRRRSTSRPRRRRRCRRSRSSSPPTTRRRSSPAKVANALRARLPARRLEVIVACDGCTDATAERAREAGADLVLELPRGGKIRAQDAGVERATRRRSSRSPTPTRCSSPTRCASSSRRSPTRDVGYVCGQVRFVNEAGTNQEGLYWRYEMALRAFESRLASRHRRQRRDLRDAHATPTSSSTRSWATTSASRSTSSSAAGARSTGRRARATEKMVPRIEGEFAAQAADDEPRLADRRPRRPARPARLPAALRADDRFSHRVLRYAGAVPARRRAAARPAAAARRCALLAAAALGRGRGRRSSRATTCSRRRRSRSASTTGCATAPRPAGRRRRARGDAPRVRRRRRRRRAAASPSPVLALAIVAIRLETQGPPDLPPAPHRQGRRAVRRAQAAHDGRRRRVDGLRPGGQRGRPAHHARRRASCAASRSTSCRTSSTSCAATWRSSARARRSRSRSSSTPSASAGASRSSPASPAGRRSTAARRCRGPSGSSSTSGTSSTARWRLDLRILLRTAAIVLGGEGLYKGETGRMESADVAGYDVARTVGAGRGIRAARSRRNSTDEATQPCAAGARRARARRGSGRGAGAVTLQPGAYHETDAGSCTLNFAYTAGPTTLPRHRGALRRRRRPARARHRGRRVRLGRRSSATRTSTAWDFAFIQVDAEDVAPRERRRQGLTRRTRRARPSRPTRSPATRSSSRATASATARPSRRRSSAQAVFALRRHRRSTRSTARSTGATRRPARPHHAPARRSASSAASASAPCTEEGPTVQGLLAKAAVARLRRHAADRLRSGRSDPARPSGPRARLAVS